MKNNTTLGGFERERRAGSTFTRQSFTPTRAEMIFFGSLIAIPIE
jgi:hypothetical protein